MGKHYAVLQKAQRLVKDIRYCQDLIFSNSKNQVIRNSYPQLYTVMIGKNATNSNKPIKKSQKDSATLTKNTVHDKPKLRTLIYSIFYNQTTMSTTPAL